jgi:Xaa-Pro aminopeptidase
MSGLSERLNFPISRDELERRWREVRTAMEAQGLDVLVMQNNNDYVGGFVRYFTDIPATNGYPVTVVFPREEPMTVIRHGRRGEDVDVDPHSDSVLRGVGRAMASPYISSAPYTRLDDAALTLDALRPFRTARIGLVGTSTIPLAFGEHLKQELHGAVFSEESDLVNRVRAVKSEEELDCVRATAALQDAAMAAAFAAAAPGRRDSEIAAVAQHAAQDLGSEQGIYWCASAPPGEPARVAHPHSQHRVMGEGDLFYLMIEVNGPGGMYTELGRICVLGSLSQQMKEEYEFCLEAQRYCMSLLKPGVAAGDVWTAYNEFLRRNGRPEEDRLHCHSQGTDLVEPPMIRAEEPFAIQANMNIACHPRYVVDGFCAWVCDNLITKADGSVEEIHKFGKQIVELG